jgi:SAM-dependent methyltransferase
MEESTRQRLLTLNQSFYQTVADEFHRSRRGWTPGLLAILPHIPYGTKQQPVKVLDVGCGNGRYALILEDRGGFTDYTGVDRDRRLLELARASTAHLLHTKTRFLQADLADPAWLRVVAEEESAQLPTQLPAQFDIVLCLATIQHLPGYDLRLRVFKDFARLAKGKIILSFWQFLTSDRFRAKLVDWSQVGLDPTDVEPGDALLPWNQGPYAVRYVHQVDEPELQRLAADAGLSIVDLFRADGKEGNLNLYAVLTLPKNGT